MRNPTLPFAAATAAILLAGAPLGASEADERIDTSFKKTFVAKTYLKDDAIRAESKDGIVTLTGTVGDESRRTLAEETAAGLPGVTRVDNRLTVKAAAGNESSDSWIGRKVTLALLFHRNVSAGATSVEVKDGVVTLKGAASSTAEKELAAEYAKDIDGVKEVRNEMTVLAAPAASERSAGEKIDDASITAQIKTALLNHRSTSSLGTRVETRNGDVTLTGIARNPAEKSLVTKIVTDIQGVGSVKNLMTVDAGAGK